MMIYFQEPLFMAVLLLGGFLVVNICAPTDAVEYHRISTLMISIVALFLGLIACISFDKAVTGFQFEQELGTNTSYNLTFSLGADGFSMIFLLLTLFIFPVLFLSA